MKLFFADFARSMATLLRLFLFIRWRKTIVRQHKKRLIVLGNGPSLNPGLDLLGDAIRGNDLICVNYFPATEAFVRLKPAFFVSSAPEFFKDDVDENYIKARNQIFQSLAEHTSWPLEFFIAWEAKKFQFWQAILAQNKNIKITFYNVHPVEGFRGFRHLLFRNQMGMPRPHNVLVPALMMGIHKGYREIVLLGADHSWLTQLSVDDQNNVLLNQKHFYDEHTSKPDVMKKLGRGQRKLHEVLWKFLYTFESYFVINEFARTSGVKILNATPGSFIDAFERISPEELKLLCERQS